MAINRILCYLLGHNFNIFRVDGVIQLGIDTQDDVNSRGYFLCRCGKRRKADEPVIVIISDTEFVKPFFDIKKENLLNEIKKEIKQDA